MSRRLEVQYCVLNTITRQYGPLHTSDLLGVSYLRPVASDVEFPTTVARLDLFVRFRMANARPATIVVRVYRLDREGSVIERPNEYRFRVPFDPAEDIRDHVFRLVNVRLTGVGVYAVRVCARTQHSWKGLRWRVLASDYFYVER